jgi:hypothetical protein
MVLSTRGENKVDKIKDDLEMAAAEMLSKAIEANNLLQMSLGNAWRAWTESSGLDNSLSAKAVDLTDISIAQAETFVQVLKLLRSVQVQVVHHGANPADGLH